MSAESAGTAKSSGTIDAVLLVVGHPSRAVSALVARCAADIVALNGPAIDPPGRRRAQLARGRDSRGRHGLPSDIKSFGGNAVFLTIAAVDPRAVSEFARALATRVETLKTKHRRLRD